MFYTCLTIFLARITDVTICTFRNMIMGRKDGIIIPLLAFCEAFVWFIAVRKALNTNLNSIFIPICYSLGYATGTYLGGFLSHKLVKEISSVEVVTKKNNYKLIDKLRDAGYAVEVISLKDNLGTNKDMLIIDVKSNLLKEIIKLIKDTDKNAFIVVKDTKIVHNGYIKSQKWKTKKGE